MEKHIKSNSSDSVLTLIDTKARYFWNSKGIEKFEKSFLAPDRYNHKNNYKSDVFNFSFGKDITERLNLITKGAVDLQQVVFSAVTFILGYKYSGSRFSSFAIPIYQNHKKTPTTNTVLPLYFEVNPEDNFKHVLNKVRKLIIDSYSNQNYSIDSLTEEYFDKKIDERFTLTETYLSFYTNQQEIIQHPYKFDIELNYLLDNEIIKCQIKYNSPKYEINTIEMLAKNIQSIISSIFKNPDTLIKDLVLQNISDSIKLQSVFEKQIPTQSHSRGIIDYFNEQVNVNPDNVFILQKDKVYTYLEVFNKVVLFANYLQSIGVDENEIVAVMLDNSADLIIALLATYFRNACFLYIDPNLPIERKKIYIKDCQVNYIITESNFLDSKINMSVCKIKEWVILDKIDLSKHTNTTFEYSYNSESVAYIIYTSGTTGNPKGVLIEQKAIMNYLIWAKNKYSNGNPCFFPFFTSMSFDLSYTSVLLPIISGGSITIYPFNETSVSLKNIFNSLYLNNIKLTPSHLKMALKISEIQIYPVCKLNLIVGGEQLDSQIAGVFYNSYNGNVRIYNEYGPTETTIGSMIYEYKPSIGFENDVVPIGSPIDKTNIKLLDRDFMPSLIGAKGELYITGNSLSRGYLSNPQLTDEKFVKNKKWGNNVFYKTGDLAKLISFDCIQFLGRIDQQVKISGYRIELSEIENHLQNYSNIQTALVITKSVDEIVSLVAYYIESEPVVLEDLRDYLFARLPYYMLPHHYVKVNCIPITAHGKVDIKMLPDPIVIKEKSQIEFTDPIQKKLAAIWSRILQVNEKIIGPDSSFFELGGQSLTLSLLIAEIYKEYRVSIPYYEIYSHQTIKAIGLLLKNKNNISNCNLKKTEKKEYYRLSDQQKRMYSVQSLNKNSTLYNMPLLLELEGEINTDLICETFQKLIKRHSILRTYLLVNNNEVFQKIENNSKWDLAIINKDLPSNEILNNYVIPFDIESFPLFRLIIFKISIKKVKILFDIHHIISDGITHKIIFKEFSQLYNNEQLTVNSFDYFDYVDFQKFYFNNRLHKGKQYWQDRLKNSMSKIKLPVKRIPEESQDDQGAILDFDFDFDIASSIRQIANSSKTSLFTLFIGTWYILLYKLSNQKDLVIGTTVLGRESHEMNNILGFFVNILPLRNIVDDQLSFDEFIKHLFDSIKNDFEYMDFQYADMINKSVTRKAESFLLFDIGFSYDSFEQESYSQDLDFSVNQVPLGKNNSKCLISLYIKENSKTFSCSFEYRSKQFTKESVEIIRDQYLVLFKDIINDQNLPICQLEYRTQIQKELEKTTSYKFDF